MIEGLTALAAMMLLCFVRVPIAFAMAITGVVGYAYMRDWNFTVALAVVQTNEAQQHHRCQGGEALDHRCAAEYARYRWIRPESRIIATMK